MLMTKTDQVFEESPPQALLEIPTAVQSGTCLQQITNSLRLGALARWPVGVQQMLLSCAEPLGCLTSSQSGLTDCNSRRCLLCSSRHK